MHLKILINAASNVSPNSTNCRYRECERKRETCITAQK